MEEIDEAHIYSYSIFGCSGFFILSLVRFLGAATGVLWSSRGFGSPLAISFIDHAYRISIMSPLSPLAHCIITSFFRFSVCSCPYWDYCSVHHTWGMGEIAKIQIESC